MAISLIFVSLILFLCIIADKFSGKFGMPALILFMGIGMLFGSDGIFKIAFSDYEFAEKICMIALCFIMFYGGFNTKWSTAKTVAFKAILLSTFGVIITATVTGLFCYFLLNFSFLESFLIGSVLSSTDAASVFSILRKKKLNLKNGTASLLEIESGSNDPVSYMLTIIGISLVNSKSLSSIPLMIFSQILFGLLIGIFFAIIGLFIIKKTTIISNGLDTIFMISLVLAAFGSSMYLNGNTLLSVYLLGIILGNSKIKCKDVLIPFFDGITGLAQILIFFLLGLLAFPHKFPSTFIPSICIVTILTLFARPLSVFALLMPFKCSIKQCLLTSWSGLRGAASIVFSIMIVAKTPTISLDVFHIVFMVALFSVAIQGTLLPLIANKLNMIDNSEDVRKTFNDYKDDSSITLMRMYIPKGHNWENKLISDVSMPTNSLALMIKRNGTTIIPKGDTMILAKDTLILSVPSYEPSGQENLKEIKIESTNKWCNKTIQQLNLPENVLIALIKRGEENLIPDGNTLIKENDFVVLYK